MGRLCKDVSHGSDQGFSRGASDKIAISGDVSVEWF